MSVALSGRPEPDLSHPSHAEGRAGSGFGRSCTRWGGHSAVIRPLGTPLRRNHRARALRRRLTAARELARRTSSSSRGAAPSDLGRALLGQTLGSWAISRGAGLPRPTSPVATVSRSDAPGLRRQTPTGRLRHERVSLSSAPIRTSGAASRASLTVAPSAQRVPRCAGRSAAGPRSARRSRRAAPPPLPGVLTHVRGTPEPAEPAHGLAASITFFPCCRHPRCRRPPLPSVGPPPAGRTSPYRVPNCRTSPVRCPIRCCLVCR